MPVVLTSTHDTLNTYAIAHGANPNVVLPLIEAAAAEAITGWAVQSIAVTTVSTAPFDEAQTVQFAAAISGIGEYSQNVTWSRTGNLVSGSVISATTGLLTLVAGEFAVTLPEHNIIITATSVDNGSITGTDTVTCTTGAFSVTYNANSGTGTTPDASSPYVEDATVTVLANSFTKANNVFSEWNTAADGRGTDRAPNDTFVITDNIVLYAIWIPRYTVTYNNNGGVGTITDATSPYNEGDTVTAEANTFTKTNFEFVSWNTAANGSGTTVAPSASIVAAANTIFYAIWAPTYVVTYDANGGATTMTDATNYGSGDTVTVLANTFTYANKVFSRFSTLANGKGLDYVNPDTFVITANVTLYAIWTTKYSLTYDGNGNTGGIAPTVNGYFYEVGDAVILGTNDGPFTLAGNHVTGWNTMANGTGVTFAASQSFIMPAANTTIYAVWVVD